MGQTKQKRWTKDILKHLEANGFHPVDVQYGSSYFIFDHGKDMIVHFHIKECKGWKFGIWWNLGGDKTFDFFTQYERDIDKFKPSASTLVEADVPLEDWYLKDLVEMCRFIKKHPYRAWALDQSYTRDIWEWGTLDGCSIDYWKAWWECSVLHPFLHERLRKKYYKIIDQIFNETKLINAKMVDLNEGGWISYPRYMFTCEGQVGEKLKPGYWEISFEGDLSKKLLKRIQRYNKLQKRIYKICFEVNDVELGDKMVIRVVDKKSERKKK